MKILYQHRCLADGAEGIHITEMIDAFRALGHEVSVDALAGSSGQGRQTQVLGRIKASLPRPLFEMASLLFNLVDYVKFRRVFNRDRPDVVYKRHAIYDMGVVLAARHAGVPLVLEINRPYSSGTSQQFEPSAFPRLVALCERKAIEKAALAVTVSTPLKTLLTSLGAKADTALVVPNGANPERFNSATARRKQIRARYGLGSSVVVGWVGILREWHRVELLLEALTRVPALQLLIVGDGPDRPRLEGLIRELYLTERVHFTDRIPHSEMADHIAAMDVAVVSDDRTGFASPMKMLEYMAMGRAVVAPRLPNIEDIAEDGRDAVLFAQGDRDGLATALARLAGDAELRARLGKAARLKIERERNWRVIAEVILREVGRRTPHTGPSRPEPARRAAPVGGRG